MFGDYYVRFVVDIVVVVIILFIGNFVVFVVKGGREVNLGMLLLLL